MDTEKLGYVPKILFKIYLKLKEKFDISPPTPEEVLYSIQICQKLVELPESVLTYTPLSDKRFIKNEKLGIFVVIANRTINVINHSYSYTVYVEENDKYSLVLKIFDASMERHRKSLEDEISTNIQHSLKNILENINNYQ